MATSAESLHTKLPVDNWTEIFLHCFWHRLLQLYVNPDKELNEYCVPASQGDS
jgi:hypothetical protein